MTNEINTTVATTIAVNNGPDLSVHAYTEGMNVSGRVFYTCLTKIKNQVPFDPTWSNGTGYYDHACKIQLPVGSWSWSHDSGSNRFIILIGTRFGVVVVFERYSHGSKSPVIVSNCPKKGYSVWQLAGLNGQLNERVLLHTLGDPELPTAYSNIGSQIETLAGLFAD